MATVAETAARNHADSAFLLVVEGLPFCYTDTAALVGEGPGSWISTETGPRRVLEGLAVTGSITYSTEMGEGKPDSEDKLEFEITDFAREWIALFADQEGKRAGGRLSPKDDPAPTDLVGMFGEAIPLWGKYIGVEAIGPAGERSYYPMLPGVSGIGLDHAAYQGEIQSLAPVYVYDTPVHADGRRAALFRIYQDLDTGTWPSWTEQFESGASLIWVGSLSADCTVKDITWSVTAEGPSSYWRKQLGANRPNTWQPVSTRLILDDTPGQREDMFALPLFFYQGTYQLEIERGGSSIFTALDVLPTAGYADDIRAAINARIATVAATPGPDIGDINFMADLNGEAGLTEDGAYTKIDNTLILANTRAAGWSLCLHRRAWAALGFNPDTQKATTYESEDEIAFLTAEEAGLPGIPGPGYIVGLFWTVPTGFTSPALAHENCDNNGQFRWHRTVSPQDIAQLPASAGFEVSLGFDAPPFFEQQQNRPVVEHTLGDGGGAVTAQAYICFRGSYATKVDEDPITMCQLAQICYRSDSVVYGADTIGLDDSDQARVVVSRWLDGRYYGMDRAPLDRTWVAADLEWCPVNLFGYAVGDDGDYAHRLLLRLALSSGGGGWVGFEGDPATCVPGANHPPALDGLPAYSDAEIASLGCNIPHSLIDIHSFAKTAATLPEGGITSTMSRCRYAWIGAQDAEELVAAIIAQRGWALGYGVNNKWRLWSRFEPLTDEDVECVISPNDIVGNASTIESVNLRPFPPRARFTVDVSRSLVDDVSGERDLVVKAQARDKASHSRLDNSVDPIEGWGLAPIPLWAGVNPPPDWRSMWQTLFATTAANWFGAAHVLVKVTVLPSIAAQIGVGSVVRYSSHYCATREGVYSAAAKLGRVYSIRHDLASRSAEIEVLLQPGTGVTSRRWGPLALVVDDVSAVEQRHSVEDRRFYCRGDWAGHGEAISDVRGFVEPAGLGIGGEAIAWGYQWNGREWELNFEFEVESVNTTSHTITYADSTFSGTFYDSRYTAIVLADHPSQPVNSWVRSLYSVISKSDGTFGAGVQAFPLVV